jgi:hypothetical protein
MADQQRQRKLPPLQLASTSLSALGSSTGRASLQLVQGSSPQHGMSADQTAARQSTVCSMAGRSGSGGSGSSGSTGSRRSPGSKPGQGGSGGARFNFFSRALRFGVGAGGGGAAAFVSSCPSCVACCCQSAPRCCCSCCCGLGLAHAWRLSAFPRFHARSSHLASRRAKRHACTRRAGCRWKWNPHQPLTAAPDHHSPAVWWRQHGACLPAVVAAACGGCGQAEAGWKDSGADPDERHRRRPQSQRRGHQSGCAPRVLRMQLRAACRDIL